MMLYLRLFFEFFKAGLFAVGGGMATIPFLYNMADATGWFTDMDLANMIAVGESTPGPIAINMATFVGFELFGFFGAMVATIAVVLPSFIVILIIAKLFEKFSKNKVVKRMFWGFKPVVAGLILSAAVTLGLSAIVPTVALKNFTFDFGGFDWWAVGIFVVAMVLSKIKRKNKTL